MSDHTKKLLSEIAKKQWADGRASRAGLFKPGHINTHIPGKSDPTRPPKPPKILVGKKGRRTIQGNLANAAAHNKRIAQYSLAGELIAIYPSRKAAAETLHLDRPSLSKAARGLLKTYHGYIFKTLAGKQ